MKKMTQIEAVKQHLLSGKTITSMEAFELYGCTRLADKVFRLRKQGYDIDCQEVVSKNRYGRPCTYAKYSLTIK